MKKVLISLMCIIMVVCFMSTVAMAEVGEDAVAKIGEQSYSTLEEAINAARNNDEIVLLKDASGNGVSVDGASGRTFTIDFAGHTYTIVGPTLAGSEGTKSQCFQLLKGSTITMKNGSIVADNEGLAMIIQNYCNLTLEDMTLDATEGNNNVSYVMSNNCGNIKIKGNTNITAKNGTKAFDVCWAPNKDYPEGAQVTVDTTGTIKGDVEFDLWGNMASPVLSTLTINNGNFEGNFVVTGLNAEDIQAKVAVNGGAFVNGKPHTWSKKSAALAGGDC